MTRLHPPFAAIILTILTLPTIAQADDTTTLTSPNGQYRLTVPKDWGPANFKVDNIQIGASYPHRGEYAEVIADRQQDYAGSINDFAEAKRDTMAMSLDNPRLSPAEKFKFHGQDAIRFELHGQLPGSGVAVGYCVAIVATKTHYIQVIGWTEDSHFADNHQDLVSLVQGFSETSDTPQ